mgnify:CR=1 FL=1
MAKILKLLSIDDDPFIHKMVQRSLDSNYIVTTASDGTEGIKVALKEKPDIILLDVEMPGMNGYETCDYLKQTTTTADIPIIFLSSLSNSRSKMLGYEAGGTDYLVKPFDASELIAKLNAITDLTQVSSKLKNQVEYATNTAFTAMKGSSELGLAIQYIESSYAIKDCASLAKSFLKITTSLKLNCTLMLQLAGERLYFTSNGEPCSPLETQVVSTLFEKGSRFVDFGCRTQINYPLVALLIKDMPIDDMEAYGRFKDFLPTMLGVTDAKINILETEVNQKNQSQLLIDAFSEVRKILTSYANTLEGNQSSAIELLQTMLTEMEHEVPDLGLDEDQEKHLMSKVDSTVISAQKLVDSSELNTGMFLTVTKLLEKIAEKQLSLISPFTNSEPSNSLSIDGVEEDLDDGFTTEVELF